MPDSGEPSYGWDKANHFVAYAVMSLLFMRVAAMCGMSSARAALAAIIAVSLFGIGVEFLQSLTSTRKADALDALANGLGAAVGVCGAVFFSLLKNRAEVKRCL
ncbi:MAG: VanZ family protein [Deltaproteobacteria bacterium]|nr:VanZ family protein [Deltaproteobacteria bacterium]